MLTIEQFRRLGNVNRQYYDEPTYLGFKVIFHFYNSPLFEISETKHCAYKYLLDEGYKLEAHYLKNMVEELKYVSQNNEWYFQSIEGLDTIWGYNFFENKVRTKENVFSINTLEGLDLRITKILDYYFQSCFSTKRFCEVVPHNLRYFDMSIYIKDLREHESNNIDFNDERNSASLYFKLSKCEFKPFTYQTIINELSNDTLNLKTNKIEIIHWGEIESYPSYVLSHEIVQSQDDLKFLSQKNPQSLLYNDNRKLSPQVNTNDSLGDLVKNTLRKTINEQSSEYLNKANGFIERNAAQLQSDILSNVVPNINSAVLGNVYKNNSKRTLDNLLSSQLNLI